MVAANYKMFGVIIILLLFKKVSRSQLLTCSTDSQKSGQEEKIVFCAGRESEP